MKCEWQGVRDRWLRWKDARGDVLPTQAEAAVARAKQEESRSDAERERADAERERAGRLGAVLRAAGLDVPG